jgi:hypothetical protein
MGDKATVKAVDGKGASYSVQGIGPRRQWQTMIPAVFFNNIELIYMNYDMSSGAKSKRCLHHGGPEPVVGHFQEEVDNGVWRLVL